MPHLSAVEEAEWRKLTGAPNSIRITCQGAALIPLEALENFQGKLKTLDEKQYLKLRKSIEEHGFSFPIAVWVSSIHGQRTGKHHHIIDGHQRLFTVTKMLKDGWTLPDPDNLLPVDWIEAQNLKEAKQKVLLAASQYGRYDEDSVARFVAEAGLDFPEIKLEIDMPQIHMGKLEAGWFNNQDSDEKADEVPEPPKKAITKLGDLWEMGDQRLLCGDCGTSSAGFMGGVDAVLTDPPYGIAQPGVPNDEPEKLETIVTSAVANLPVKDSIVIAFQSTRTFPVWLDATRRAGHSFERMLWLYKAAQCTFPWRGWILTSEAILTTTVGTPKWEEVKPYSHDCYYLSEVSGELDKDLGWHGSVKPLSVVTDLLQRISPQHGTVFDGFLGSGTTMIAAEKLNRRCYGIEIEPRYVDVCVERWENFTGGKAKRTRP